MLSYAIDGDPGTEWSSNGDGDRAWIEIELARSYRIIAIGLWTRTMGTSAQIQRFEVLADGARTLGPFTVPDAGGIHYYLVDIKARTLRFRTLNSSSGNTGAVEIEVIAAP